MFISPILVLLILIFPFFDLYLLIKVGAAIGAAVAIFLVVFTTVLGFLLIKHQGVNTFSRLTQSIQAGEPPARALVDSVIVLFGAFLLIIPGFISDFLGLLTLLPWFRDYIWQKLAKHTVFNVQINDVNYQVYSNDEDASKKRNDPRTIEGDYKREDK